MTKSCDSGVCEIGLSVGNGFKAVKNSSFHPTSEIFKRSGENHIIQKGVNTMLIPIILIVLGVALILFGWYTLIAAVIGIVLIIIGVVMIIKRKKN